MRDVFIERLSQLAAQDDRIFLITGDLGFGVLNEFERRFPNQYLNVGVAEQNMTGVATGLAMEGRVVFTYSIGNFPTLRCLEQIRNDAAYHSANVKVVAIGGGFSYGQLGMSHHATEDLAILRALPTVTVVSPGDDWEADHATTAIAKTPGTCYLRLDRASVGTLGGVATPFELGRARMIRDGSAVTIIAIGAIVGIASRVAAEFEKVGVEVRVLSMHSLAPFDTQAVLDAARETGGIMTLEEHGLRGGLGSAVCEALSDNGVAPKRFKRLGLPNRFASSVGDQNYLRASYGIDEYGVRQALLTLLK